MQGIILAGGKNIRMGRVKALLTINGETIIEDIAEKLQRILLDIIIVTNTPELFEFMDIPMISDIMPERGSLGGIYSGIYASNSFHSFVVACDMPFLVPELIKYMISEKDDYDIVIPNIDGEYEPLHAIYSKNCLKYMEMLIKENNLKILDFFDKVKVRNIDRTEVLKFASPEVCFYNINTPEDVVKSMEILSRENRRHGNLPAGEASSLDYKGNIIKGK